MHKENRNVSQQTNQTKIKTTAHSESTCRARCRLRRMARHVAIGAGSALTLQKKNHDAIIDHEKLPPDKSMRPSREEKETKGIVLCTLLLVTSDPQQCHRSRRHIDPGNVKYTQQQHHQQQQQHKNIKEGECRRKHHRKKITNNPKDQGGRREAGDHGRHNRGHEQIKKHAKKNKS